MMKKQIKRGNKVDNERCKRRKENGKRIQKINQNTEFTKKKRMEIGTGEEIKRKSNVDNERCKRKKRKLNNESNTHTKKYLETERGD